MSRDGHAQTMSATESGLNIEETSNYQSGDVCESLIILVKGVCLCSRTYLKIKFRIYIYKYIYIRI